MASTSNSTAAFVSTVLACLLASCSSGSGGPASVADSLTKAQFVDGSYISWKEHRIDDEDKAGGVRIRGADGLEMADLDQDGYLDIVSVHEDSSHIRLAFGSEDADRWFRLTLGEGPEAGAAEDVAIGDLNGDGYPDAIAACEQAHLTYFQNPGGKVRGWRWERVIPEITTHRGSFIRVFLADFNNDGRLEVVAANKGTGRHPGAAEEKPETEISWFEAPADPLDGSAWKEHVLTRVRVPINSAPVDLDGDGDVDILGGSRGESRIFWFENLGGDEIAFRQHRIEVEGRTAPQELGELRLTGFNVDFFDFSGDGRLDVILTETPNSLVWLEQPSDFSQPWKIHSIGTIAPDHLVGLAVADINNDDQPDVMTGAYSRGPRDEDGPEVTAADPVGRLAWFENPGDAGGTWQRHDISRRKRGMFDAFIPRDMDDDGDIDFVATRGNSGNYDGVFWLEQRHSARPVKVFQPARETESEQLSLPPH